MGKSYWMEKVFWMIVVLITFLVVRCASPFLVLFTLDGVFVGSQQYLRLILEDDTYWRGLLNTLIIGALYLIPTLLLAWLAAWFAAKRTWSTVAAAAAAILFATIFVLFRQSLLSDISLLSSLPELYMLRLKLYPYMRNLPMSLAALVLVPMALETAALRLAEKPAICMLLRTLSAVLAVVMVIQMNTDIKWNAATLISYILTVVICAVPALILLRLRKRKTSAKRVLPT